VTDNPSSWGNYVTADTGCSPIEMGPTRCCGWTTVRRWFLKRCNGSNTGNNVKMTRPIEDLVFYEK
jgi:hypothetical protein